MKSIVFLISIFLVMGLSTAHAQTQVNNTGGKKTRDILFPDYAKDQIKLKGTGQLQAKNPEAQIKSPQALMDMIFKPGSYSESGAARTSTPAPAKEAPQLGSSKNIADAVKEMKEQQAAAQAKIVAPKLEQGTEPQPKPKN